MCLKSRGLGFAQLLLTAGGLYEGAVRKGLAATPPASPVHTENTAVCSTTYECGEKPRGWIQFQCQAKVKDTGDLDAVSWIRVRAHSHGHLTQ